MAEEAENVTDNNKYKHIEEAVLSCPAPLNFIKNKAVIDAIDAYLPYSVGMEFECFQKENFDVKSFESIPNIMSIEVDSSEQRYRIPKGLRGMICLYEICQLMKQYSALDLRSSNHYHFDFTDIPDRNECINNENKEYILKELETWGTALDLSQRNNWIRFFNPLGTLEIRIGEPSFDYEIIMKRLIQGSKISKRIKDIALATEDERKLIRLKEELTKLEEKNDITHNLPVNEIKQTIKSRINKI